MTTYRKFFQDRDSNAFATLFTDFFNYRVAEWVVTNVGANTEALTPGPGGQLLITNAAADNDLTQLQWAGDAGAGAETFKYVAGKKLQFTCRFKLSRVDGDFFAGLYITDADPVGGVSDGIFFRKLAAEAGLSLVVEKNASESTVEVITTLVADTWYIVEFYYDGEDDKIKAYVDRTGAGSVPLTNAPDDEDLALAIAVQNGSANASTMTVDFIGAQQER
jgi:hypothetical protein